MENQIKDEQSVYVQADDFYGKKSVAVPKPPKDIGVDYNGELYKNLIDGLSSTLDITLLNSFTNLSQSRDTIYSLLDSMSEDATIAAALETYAEDITEETDDGRIVYCQSDDSDIYKYVTFLLDSLNIDKHIYSWAYALVKYGDVYIRLYRKSDIEKDEKDFIIPEDKRRPLQEDVKAEDTDTINEDVNIVAYSPADKYSHYVEMWPNPAEIFELTKFGKSYAYIEAPVATPIKTDNLINSYYRYSFKQNDVNLYDATSFVHASLMDNSTRTPEEVELFKDDESMTNGSGVKYIVRRGQSILYNSFKIWREMMLLENAMLLNRITKSSIARIIGVEIGDMPKEEVPNKLMSVKQLFEQKAALNAGNSMAEYTNPGPMENNVYVPTHGGIGSISIQQVGGDVDVKGLGDIDYFKTKLYSALRIPKQFLGDTDDATGFNGGTALSIVSSRYAKAVKRIQSALTQAITDMVNLMLLDKHLDSYVNKFSIKMTSPTTQEELDKRDAMQTRISMISDVMALVADIEDMSAKFRILKSLITEVVPDEELGTVLDEQIAKLLEQEQMGVDTTDDETDTNFGDIGGGDGGDNFDFDFGGDTSGGNDLDTAETTETENEGGDETVLPTPADLGAGDFTDANMEI